jgi:serine protease Do
MMDQGNGMSGSERRDETPTTPHPVRRDRRWLWPAAGVAVAVSIVAVSPHIGLTKAARGPLWTERPVVTAPSQTMAPDWVRIGKELKPAVVNIAVKRAAEGEPANRENLPRDGEGLDQFRRFFEGQPRRPVRNMGTGFIINPDGYIVTNNHVVEGAGEIQVKLADGRELPGKIVGGDPKTDLAVVKIEATGLPVIPFGDSATLEVGEPVMAIGNPFGLEATVTTGIVSATGRVIGSGPYDDYIQTDASINPGNSGGPLINAKGQAVGINTAIYSETGGSVGIGFAIPAKLAKSVVTQLADHGHVVRGWLGVTIQPLTPELAKAFQREDKRGALVSSVAEGSPAQKAGLKPGDIITEYNGRPVAKSDDLPRAVAETVVGKDVALTITRDGKAMTVTAKVGELEDAGKQVAAQVESKAASELRPAAEPVLARELGQGRRGRLVTPTAEGARRPRVGPRDVIVEVDHNAACRRDLKKKRGPEEGQGRAEFCPEPRRSGILRRRGRLGDGGLDGPPCQAGAPGSGRASTCRQVRRPGCSPPPDFPPEPGLVGFRGGISPAPARLARGP